MRDGGSGLSKYDQLRADLQDEIARGLAEVEKEGDKIIVRLASQGGFVSGSAGVRESFSPTLTKLGNTLSKYPGMVKVEGHTDNVPVAFSEKFKSNWDLYFNYENKFVIKTNCNCRKMRIFIFSG